MELWSNEEMMNTGKFVERHGLPVGMELELLKLTEKFAKISKDFGELDDEHKIEKRKEFFEAQNIFFSVGAKIANLFVNKETVTEQQGASANVMQVDEQQPSTSEGANTGTIVRTIATQQVEDLEWVPYVQFRKILQPVLELQSGNLTSHTMSDIYHAIEVAKNKARAMEFVIGNAEQPIMAIVHSKFDVITKGIWEFQLTSVEPTIEVLERFLETRATMIHNELELPQPQPAQAQGPVPETGIRRKQPICIYCKSTTHTIYKCSSGFESLTIAAKKQFLRREGRCDNCFMKHPNDICTGGACWVCKVQHNSMLCPKNPKNL